MEEIISLLKAQLNSNQFFQGGFVLGILSYIGYQLREIPMKMWNWVSKFIIYEVYFDDTTDFYNVFTKWYSNKYSHKFRRTEVKFQNIESLDTGQYSWNVDRYQYVDTNFIWDGIFPLVITKSRQVLENASQRWDRYNNSYTIRGIFAKSKIDKICQEILQLKINIDMGDTLKVKISSRQGDIVKYIRTHKTFDSLFFKTKQLLIDDLSFFLSQRTEYSNVGVNHRRGYLLFGPPGTGKTSICFAVAKYCKRSLYIINLGSIKDDDDLQYTISYIPAQALVVMEDIDRIFDSDGKIIDGVNITMSTLLNVIGGSLTPLDCIIIATCNDISKLDSALIRSGRFDLHLEVSYPSLVDVFEYINTYFPAKNIIADKFKNVNLNSIVLTSMSEIEKVLLNNSNIDDLYLLLNEKLSHETELQH